MVKLKKKGTFAENLAILLETVQDEDVQGFLESHSALIQRLASESSQDSRDGLVKAVEGIIEARLDPPQEEE